MSVSDYYEVKILDHMLRNVAFTPPTTIYVSLHTADPTDTFSPSNEVTGGSYARQTVTFNAATSPGGLIDNIAALVWTNMPACTVTHVGLYDALTVGNGLWSGALTASKTLNAGDTFQINAGDLDVTMA